MSKDFSPENIYRMPWNFADNAISWLEPTSKCNLYCDGCYRENRINSHKTLEEIRHDLEVFKKNRRCDSVSIAGGEPLMHPDICTIVRMIKEYGWKPTINTNGALLTKELLHELKLAGIYGFTVHIDSGQSRAGWKGKNEIELNELRLQIAEMIAGEGGLSCTFNATIYPDTVQYINDLLKWSQQYIDKVHSMVLILYRMAILGKDVDFYIGTEKVKFDDMMYSKEDDNRRTDITSPEVVDVIRQEYPDFMPSAFLNGTQVSDSYKWLMTGRMGNSRQIFGYVGPKFMELVQSVKHLFTGTYLAYATPSTQSIGLLYFLLSPIDKGIRKAAANYFKSFISNTLAFFKKVHYQTVLIIQPADIMETGDVNMCDGCPDITVWNDQLVWSCRMEEQFRWGQNVRMVPVKKEQEE